MRRTVSSCIAVVTMSVAAFAQAQVSAFAADSPGADPGSDGSTVGSAAACSRAGHGGLSVGLSVGACRSVAVGISLRGGRPGVVIFRVVIGLVILLGAAAAAAVGHDTGTSGIVFVISLLVVRRGVRVGGFRVAALAAAAWCAAAGGWGAMPVPSAR